MENPLDGPWPSAAVSGRCVGRTDTVELRCSGNGSVSADSGTRSAATTGQFRTLAWSSLGEIVVWTRPDEFPPKAHADEQGAAGTRLQREDRCLIEAPVAIRRLTNGRCPLPAQATLRLA